MYILLAVLALIGIVLCIPIYGRLTYDGELKLSIWFLGIEDKIYPEPPETPSKASEKKKAGETVTIRFRTAKNNVDHVFLVKSKQSVPMVKVESDENFDFYACEIMLGEEKLHYHFVVETGRISVVFDTRGMVREANEYYDFVVIPGFSTPQWAKGAVMYQIYVDRFCNGDPGNDVLTDEYNYINEHVHRVEDWYRKPAAMDVREFYGGDLQGVLDKMDYLQDLGIQVIYFNPLFVSPSNHKYDIQDYDYIDPHFGKIVDDGGELLQHWDRDLGREI